MHIRFKERRWNMSHTDNVKSVERRKYLKLESCGNFLMSIKECSSVRWGQYGLLMMSVCPYMKAKLWD